jgi:cell division protein FtsI/penicillin-binding protein 2
MRGGKRRFGRFIGSPYSPVRACLLPEGDRRRVKEIAAYIILLPRHPFKFHHPRFTIAFTFCFVTCFFALKKIFKNNKLLLCFFLLLLAQVVSAQYVVQGHVYDSTKMYALESVTVASSSGKGAMTDSNGHYKIEVKEKDSIWFSYLGKPTVKFPVLKIADVNQFDIALRINIPVLSEVRIRPRNYRQDSMQNRLDYAKIFNFHKPNLESMTSIGPSGAGIDINELIRAFQFQKNKSNERFKQRLLEQEQEKFVDHRFSKALVRRLTNLADADLDRFMALYRPSYEYTLYASDYDFQLYIKTMYEQYSKRRSF